MLKRDPLFQIRSINNNVVIVDVNFVIYDDETCETKINKAGTAVLNLMNGYIYVNYVVHVDGFGECLLKELEKMLEELRKVVS